ncbi:ferredoxin [Actinokineospora iranica]|uniref:Ferredoxin n=1 Tax=Actinokineospora iranica TaxID=1271860 RepID=A0A1G6Y7J3_9PSEU|nr:ferredoxin [Actinokineospora iranica]SDD85555.1 ferredoxin [Actinokineospora iranica]
MTWKLGVDAGRCMASGVCVATAPDHFELNGTAATVRATDIDPDENVLDAAESCPALAISVTEDGRDLLE